MDALIAARWPDRWARANDPRLRNRSKARNNLRKCFRAAVARDAFKAANPDARCSNCDNAKRNPSPGIVGLACLADSDFHGYQMVDDASVCTRWRRAAGSSIEKALCPHFEDHTPCPEGYLQWHEWAEKMMKTHRQLKCAGCNRYSIWEPKSTLAASVQS